MKFTKSDGSWDSFSFLRNCTCRILAMKAMELWGGNRNYSRPLEIWNIIKYPKVHKFPKINISIHLHIPWKLLVGFDDVHVFFLNGLLFRGGIPAFSVGCFWQFGSSLSFPLHQPLLLHHQMAMMSLGAKRVAYLSIFQKETFQMASKRPY